MPADPNSRSRNLRDQLEAEYLRRETELTELIAEVDAAFTFAQLLQWALVRGAQDGGEAEHGLLPSLIEFAAFQLYPRFGLEGPQDAQAVERVMDALKELNQRRAIGTLSYLASKETEHENSGITVMFAVTAYIAGGLWVYFGDPTVLQLFILIACILALGMVTMMAIGATKPKSAARVGGDA
jgi:hypothetical protein